MGPHLKNYPQSKDDGNLVNSWPSSYQPGNVAYLLEDGLLLRTGTIGNPIFTAGGAGGKIQKIAWDGSLEWDYTYSSNDHLQHDAQWIESSLPGDSGWRGTYRPAGITTATAPPGLGYSGPVRDSGPSAV